MIYRLIAMPLVCSWFFVQVSCCNVWKDSDDTTVHVILTYTRSLRFHSHLGRSVCFSWLIHTKTTNRVRSIAHEGYKNTLYHVLESLLIIAQILTMKSKNSPRVPRKNLRALENKTDYLIFNCFNCFGPIELLLFPH